MCVVWYVSIWCVYVCTFKSIVFSTACFTDALYEKKLTIMTNENDIAKLQAQVEASYAEKDSLIAKYEAMVKESKG